MIHQTAIIDSAARIGADVTIGPFTCVEGDVEIGDRCVIGPRVSLMRYTRLGPDCRVHAGAVLGDLPQDTSYKECRSEVRIGAGCVIREGVTVHRGTKADSVTEVGDGCWLMAFSHLAHNVRLGERVMVVNGALLAGYVTVGDRAFISGNCGIHQFCRIGRLAMLGGNCSVTKDVPPFGLLESGSLNGLVGVNIVGLRRAGMDGDQRQVVKQAFKVLFRSGLNFAQATAALRAEVQDPLIEELCAFIDASQRGVCPFSGNRAEAAE